MNECTKCLDAPNCSYLAEKRVTYRDTIGEIRKHHYKRCFQYATLYNNGVLNISNTAYFNGWSAITGLVSKTVGPAKFIIRDGKEELAIELAQKLSDLFFEYREKALKIDMEDEEDIT